ncbi:Uncharacterised protein [Mycobacteroides abscessus subsp. abscessus]|nr:Uncharacterised protein [Mycobacteroides abscessus subsp. abscessus]
MSSITPWRSAESCSASASRWASVSRRRRRYFAASRPDLSPGSSPLASSSVVSSAVSTSEVTASSPVSSSAVVPEVMVSGAVVSVIVGFLRSVGIPVFRQRVRR